MTYFMKGIFIGLIFGIPAGAVGALTVRRTITHGRAAGFFSGLGCSAADLCYCCISIFGFSLISDFILKYQAIITFCGGILIVLMGIGLIAKKQSAVTEPARAAKLVSFFVSSFLIAIANPATIVTFLLAFSVFQIGEVASVYDGVGTALGIVTGTCIWWTVISLTVGSVRSRITQRKLAAVNFILGTLVLVFGVVVLAKSIYSF